MASTSVARTGGTARTKAGAGVIDIDAELEEEFPGWRQADIETVEVQILGESFHIVKNINAWNLINLDNGDESDFRAISQLLIGSVVQGEEKKLSTVLAKERHLNVDVLMKILTRVMQAASGEVPTKRPSASGRSSGKRAAITP